METLLRHWNTLRLIPRLPRKIEISRVLAALEDLGFKVSVRTVQRDLNTLSQAFPLGCDEARPAGWYWEKHIESFDIPCLHPHAALTFLMARDFLSKMLPPGCLEHLDPHFTRASKVLDEIPNGLGTWRDQIEVVSRHQPLLSPTIDPLVMEGVYESLLEQRQISIRYRRRGEAQVREYKANPLGLIFADQLIYLVCTLFKYDDPVLLLLHRMEGTRLLDAPARKLEGFSLRQYVASGHMGFPRSDGTLHVRLRFDAEAANHLTQTPLSTDQRLSQGGVGKTIVEATVCDTAQLRWWILGFGEQVEVLGPVELRQEIAEKCRRMNEAYREDVKDLFGG